MAKLHKNLRIAIIKLQKTHKRGVICALFWHLLLKMKGKEVILCSDSEFGRYE